VTEHVHHTEHIARPLLRRLADRMGIVESYVDQSGGEVRHTSDFTRQRLLAAMGIDASTEKRAAKALRAHKVAAQRRWIDPVRVVRQRRTSLSRVAVRVPALHAERVQWTLRLRTEEGIETWWSGQMHGGPARKEVLSLPVIPPLGYHDLTVTFEGAGEHHTATQRLIIVPPQCTPPETRLHGHRGFGLTTNLYTVRSDTNWGAGDIGDMKTIAEWVGQHGGAFVGMNPLHALRNDGYDVSPYSPITRLFRNPLYLRVHDIPEFRYDAAVHDLVA
jgi:4-alpha-glucanotransferase